jgi:uncharacterized surface protein with fasciclin (FAS1) repeats
VVLRHPDRILSVCYAVLFNLDIDFFEISMIRKADTGVSNVPNAQLEIANIWRSQMRIFKHTALAGALSLSMLGASVAQAKDIVDTAASAGSFETLVAAVKAAGLVDTLKGSGPYTVFAPTDEAFAALPAGTVEELLKPENKDQLVKILTYHVIPGKVMASDVMGKQVAVGTVEGADLYASGLSAKGVTVAPMRTYDASMQSTVIKADIMTDNGVIHVIDKVLIPES